MTQLEIAQLRELLEKESWMTGDMFALRESASALLTALSLKEKSERHLLDLLAVIHRDGGHYTADHGLEASFRDAIKAIGMDRVALESSQRRVDELEKQLAAIKDEQSSYAEAMIDYALDNATRYP